MVFISTLLTAAMSASSCLPSGQLEITDNTIQQVQASSVFIDESIDDGLIQNCATVSVLTHGMGGSFEDFLVKNTDGTYSVLSNSLPDLLQNNIYRYDALTDDSIAPEDNIYVFGYEDSDFIFKRLSLNSATEHYSLVSVNLESIDITSNIMLIYNGDMESSVSDCYDSFKPALNEVIGQIGSSQTGILPKINLIGHSKGGLVNAEYAIEYPEIINTFTTLGSPLGNLTYASKYVELLSLITGEEVTDYDDLLDNDELYDRCSRFNAVSSLFYSQSISFIQTTDFFYDSLSSVISYINSNYVSMSEDEISDAVSLINFFRSHFTEFLNDFSNENAHDIINAAGYLASKFLPSDLNAYASLIIDVLNYLVDDYWNSAVYGNVFRFDSLVNYNSSVGMCATFDTALNTCQYDFDENAIVEIGGSLLGDNPSLSDTSAMSEPDMPAVAHNFETKSGSAARSVTTLLNMNSGFHKHNFVDSYDQTSHFKSCGCGAVIQKEDHNLALTTTSTTHTYQCLSDECGYELTDEHTFEYLIVRDRHVKKCTVCNFRTIETHNYNVYLSIGLTRHEIYCLCGNLSCSEPHTFGVDGRCVYCGQANTSGGSAINPQIIDE